MLSVILAALLQAAPAALPPPGLPAPKKLGTLFIAPSGEPFRGVQGEPYPVGTWFARADADADGKLTRGEFRRDALVFFPALDIDADGVIDAREIARYEETVVPEVRVGFADTPQFRGPAQVSPTGVGSADARLRRRIESQPRGAGRYALINAPQPVVSADTDFNRRITPAEMSAAADRRFTALDPEGRGYLTLAGLPETPIQKNPKGR